MAKWKEVEMVELCHGDAPFTVGAPESGAWHITVEEEVSICCEIWRNQIPYREKLTFQLCMSDSPPYVEYIPGDGPCKFCPECGKRL